MASQGGKGGVFREPRRPEKQGSIVPFTASLPGHHGVMESQIIRPGHLTAHQTAQQLGITLGGVRQLVRRGRLKRSGGTIGQPWYAVEDVAALDAERRARRAA